MPSSLAERALSKLNRYGGIEMVKVFIKDECMKALNVLEEAGVIEDEQSELIMEEIRDL